MLYPPKGRLAADSSRAPIIFTYVLFWVRKTLEAFQFSAGNPPFSNVENVLSHDGDVCLHTPVGVQLFLLMFYPPKGTKEVQLFLLISYFGLGNVYWTFCFRSGTPPFWNLENFYPPKGLWEAEPNRVHLTTWTFRFRGGNPPFWNLENVEKSQNNCR